MTLKVKALVLAGLAALPLMVNAQPAAKEWELTLGGSGTATSDFKAEGDRAGGQFGTSLGVGYYLNENLEIAGRQTFSYATSGSWSASTLAALDWNFRLDKFVPFVGGNVGYLYGNRGREDSWSAGPEGGIKYYLLEKAFLFGMGTYNIPFHGKGHQWVFTLGLGVNL